MSDTKSVELVVMKTENAPAANYVNDQQGKPLWIGKKGGGRKGRYIDLSSREEEILLQLRTKEIKVIAKVLSIEESTVRSHISKINKKIRDAKRFIKKMKKHESVLHRRRREEED